MKKFALVLTMMLLGAAALFAQSTETGYVTVKWTPCDECCSPMQYFVAYSVGRVSDNSEVAHGWTVVSDQYTEHIFEFEFPCGSPGEDFMVYARVVAGCDFGGLNETICCSNKNPGEPADCSELMEGFDIWVEL
ncbi:MAG: hypothetical protein M0Q51_17370 [Bacteroidales bacterium]|nr:hypothetical protein [Bacteroidales bacterium]